MDDEIGNSNRSIIFKILMILVVVAAAVVAWLVLPTAISRMSGADHAAATAALLEDPVDSHYAETFRRLYPNEFDNLVDAIVRTPGGFSPHGARRSALQLTINFLNNKSEFINISSNEILERMTQADLNFLQTALSRNVDLCSQYLTNGIGGQTSIRDPELRRSLLNIVAVRIEAAKNGETEPSNIRPEPTDSQMAILQNGAIARYPRLAEIVSEFGGVSTATSEERCRSAIAMTESTLSQGPEFSALIQVQGLKGNP